MKCKLAFILEFPRTRGALRGNLPRIQVAVFWVVKSCNDVKGYRCFGESYYFWLSLPWIWRYCGSSKRWYPSISLHGVTTYKTVTWIFIAVKSWIVTLWESLLMNANILMRKWFVFFSVYSILQWCVSWNLSGNEHLSQMGKNKKFVVDSVWTANARDGKFNQGYKVVFAACRKKCLKFECHFCLMSWLNQGLIFSFFFFFFFLVVVEPRYIIRHRAGLGAGRFPGGAGNFSLHHRVQNGSGPHTASYPMGKRGSFLGGRGVILSSAEVKEWVELYIHSPNKP